MVLTSPSASQTRRLAWDFKAFNVIYFSFSASSYHNQSYNPIKTDTVNMDEQSE